jgi:hypothetical protein
MAVFDTQSLLSWSEINWSRFEAAETTRGAIARPTFPLSLHGGIDATK